MFNLSRKSSVSAALLALGLITATVTPVIISIPASSQTPTDTPTTPSQTPSDTPTTPSPQAQPTATTSFSDVSGDYWAQPFIQALAQRNVISGFPDGTFKPDQPVSRAEFAAMIQKAFNQNQVRQLAANGFSDVPRNYWAFAAIQEAYETGFMSGYPGNVFRPNQQIPKVQALVALTSGLNLTTSSSVSEILATYYTDATAIPSYAVNNVAAATEASVVVNYPNIRQLNPQVPLTRAEAAAHLYQALVKLGQVQPLASNVTAAAYIVGRNTSGGTTGSTPTGGNDIVSLTASSNSLSTLTSALRAAGLEQTLQGSGPFTLFAPTDEAFAALPAETRQRLLQPENREALIKILSYHVVPGAVTSTQLQSGKVKTAEGNSVNVNINRDRNSVSVNNANVIQPDVQASNGVIHVVDKVLIPPDVRLVGQAGTGVDAGRATRGGRSYIGVGGNIGLGGDSALAEGNFAVISKIGLTRNISVRPSAVIGDDTVVLVPLTLDFSPRAANPTGGRVFPISPFVGAGVAIETSNDANLGLLLTGGVDVPIASRFTLTGTVNAAFLEQTDVGLMLGVGLNF